MKAGDMTDGIFLIHIVDALQETISKIKEMREYQDAIENDGSF